MTDLGIEIVETWDAGRHIIEIVDTSVPTGPVFMDDRLRGLSQIYQRRYGGEWVGDFETGEMSMVKAR